MRTCMNEPGMNPVPRVEGRGGRPANLQCCRQVLRKPISRRETNAMKPYLLRSMQKLHDARRCLMLPNPGGETTSIVEAFAECRAGLEVLPTDLEEDARAYIDTINETMGKTGI